MLRELGLTPWQYGLALGVLARAAWLLAALPPLTRRLGARTVLLATGVLRTPWLFALPLAPTSTSGLVAIILAEAGLLLAAGLFNPSFITYRTGATENGRMSRVGAA